MTPLLAAIVCAVFVLHLFWQDAKSNPGASPGLWIPLIWMFLAGSRWASSWLNLSAPSDTEFAYAEGSPIDRAVFLLLIGVGAVVLARRKIAWGPLLGKNRLLLLYFLYCLVSISWSDEPFVAFKRWFKDLGNPIMVLVILTTPNPLQALAQTMRRLSFLFLPLSLLFVRYYPELGRAYKTSGEPMYTGIGSQKNDLGLMCLMAGIYFLWQIFQDRARFLAWAKGQRLPFYLLAAILAWLLHMSDSQTSLSCLVVSGAVILAGQLPFVRSRPPALVPLIVTTALGYMALDMVFDFRNQLLSLLGRDPSLTNRTEVWKLLFSMDTNPMFGSGFMSFWTGERMQQIWSTMGTINQAHSGYIEQYLNLGYVGVAFMALLLVVAFLRAGSQLGTEPSMATLRICLILSAILYNYTEASFYGVNNMWVLTLVALIQLPDSQQAPVGSASPNPT